MFLCIFMKVHMTFERFFFVIIDSFERFGPFVDHFVWPFFILFLAVLVPFLARNPKKKIDFFGQKIIKKSKKWIMDGMDEIVFFLFAPEVDF